MTLSPHDKSIIHGSLESDYRTPPECFNMLAREFYFGVDLAADRGSALVERYLGPGSPEAENALQWDWAGYARYGCAFINPPFSKTLVNAYNTGRIKIDGAWAEHTVDKVMAECYDVENWARKCWEESQKGLTIVGIFPFAPQTEWYRRYVCGHLQLEDYKEVPTPNVLGGVGWAGHAAMQERRLPHRISFLTPAGEKTGNAGVNSAIVVWQPNCGIVGPWQPHSFYWSYRPAA